jgi:glycosyltransferase involved in cell wall biosynthesis
MTEFRIFGYQLDAESNLRQLMALAKRGHEVTYLAARTSRFKDLAIHVQGFRLETVLLRRVTPILSLILFELMVAWHFLTSIDRYDVVILNDESFPALFPFLVLQHLFSRFPVLFLRIASKPVEVGGFLRSLAATSAYVLSIQVSKTLFHKIFFISPMLAQSTSLEFDISRNRVGVWPSSVDADVFDPTLMGKSVGRLRKELRLQGKLGVLYHGVLSKGRGIMEMVEAFRILKEESTRAILVLLGDGPARNNVLRYLYENELREFVQVRGAVNYQEVPTYIAACDVEIVPLPDHPWWRYQCPIKVLESLAMNKPLIISDIPANRWIVGNARVALYLTGTTPREIANGVQTFLATRNRLDPSLGRKIALEFSSEKIAEMLENQALLAIGLSHRLSGRH